MTLPEFLLLFQERIERELSKRSNRQFKFHNGAFRSGQIAISLESALKLIGYETN